MKGVCPDRNRFAKNSIFGRFLGFYRTVCNSKNYRAAEAWISVKRIDKFVNKMPHIQETCKEFSLFSLFPRNSSNIFGKLFAPPGSSLQFRELYETKREIWVLVVLLTLNVQLTHREAKSCWTSSKVPQIFQNFLKFQ